MRVMECPRSILDALCCSVTLMYGTSLANLVYSPRASDLPWRQLGKAPRHSVLYCSAAGRQKPL